MIVWECPQCGFFTKSYSTLTVPFHCSCGFADETGEHLRTVDKLEDLPPTMAQKIRNFATATEQWYLAGRPERTDEQVSQLLEDRCSQCEYFRDHTCMHAKCGCGVLSVDQEKTTFLGRYVSGALVNKLRMATEKCPDGKW